MHLFHILLIITSILTPNNNHAKTEQKDFLNHLRSIYYLQNGPLNQQSIEKNNNCNSNIILSAAYEYSLTGFFDSKELINKLDKREIQHDSLDIYSIRFYDAISDLNNPISDRSTQSRFGKIYEILEMSEKNSWHVLTELSIHSILFFGVKSGELDINLANDLISDYSEICESEVQMFWLKYFSIIMNNKNSFETNSLFDTTFVTLHDLARDIGPFYKGLASKLESIYLDIPLQKVHDAIILNQNAQQNFQECPQYFLCRKNSSEVMYNYALLLNQKGEHRKAVSIIKEFIKTQDQSSFGLSNKKIALEALCPILLGLRSDEYNFYEIERQKVTDQISSLQLSSNLLDAHTRYAVAQKDAQISQLQTWKSAYDHNKYWIAASLVFIFGLSVYSYIRWKRSDQQKALVSAEKSLLEAEHQKVQQEINKVKELVIKDHIVLKNKAKVLVTDLLYIKSDDHYLRLQTAHGEEFVRGKLSALIEELPPNFVRCHRSYIVNLNTIAQFRSNDVVLTNGDAIPVSRKYKENVENYL